MKKNNIKNLGLYLLVSGIVFFILQLFDVKFWITSFIEGVRVELTILAILIGLTLFFIGLPGERGASKEKTILKSPKPVTEKPKQKREKVTVNFNRSTILVTAILVFSFLVLISLWQMGLIFTSQSKPEQKSQTQTSPENENNELQQTTPSNSDLTNDPYIPKFEEERYQSDTLDSQIEIDQSDYEFNGEMSVTELIDMLETGYEDERIEAAQMLGLSESNEAFTPLINALKDNSPAVREVVAISLGLLGMDEAIRYLIESFSDEDPLVRAAAAIAVAVIHPTGNLKNIAIKSLEKLLTDPDEYVRLNAEESLMMLENK